MQLFIHITSQENTINPILEKMLASGFHGASIIDCEGMLTSLNNGNCDNLPIFGALRQYLNPERPKHKMLVTLVKDEDIITLKNIIHEVAGSLKMPNTGIFFTLPVTNWEGVSHK